jgi:hypothetical protein
MSPTPILWNQDSPKSIDCSHGALSTRSSKPRRLPVPVPSKSRRFLSSIDTLGLRRELRVMLLRGAGKYFSAGVEISLEPNLLFAA